MLVVLARGGNDGAFEELVRRRQGAVRALLRRLSGNAALGDDLAQEAFVTACRALQHLRDPSAFGPWLHRVAVNVWLQHARRGRWLEESIEDHGTDLALEIPAPDPSDRIDLDRMLAKLRAPERLCVVLAYMEGMSHTEIASATGIPLGTVKSHVSRAVARLRAGVGHNLRGKSS